MLSTGRRLALGDSRLILQRVSGYTTSSQLQMGFGSHCSDNDPDVLHKEKERNLRAGKPRSAVKDLEEGWNEKLASDSEAAVKAERHHNDDESIEELQKKSVHHIRTEHHEEEHVVESASQEKDDLKKGKANPVHA
ncbi:g7110 [Coccomyxa elongata]